MLRQGSHDVLTSPRLKDNASMTGPEYSSSISHTTSSNGSIRCPFTILYIAKQASTKLHFASCKAQCNMAQDGTMTVISTDIRTELQPSFAFLNR